MGHVGSYLWELRNRVGPRLILMPGAQVIVLNTGGAALFQRRADTGEWEFPGGGAEPGQDFRSTAAAELAEEAGLVVDPAALVPFATLSNPAFHELNYPNGDRVHAFALCFAHRGFSGTLRAEESEVSSLGFHPLSEPPQPMSRAAARVLELYREFVRTGAFQAD